MQDLVFEGNAAMDPELRYTTTGKPVVDLVVIVNGRRRDTAGEWVDDEPTRWRVTCWDRLAETIAESVGRGDRVVVVGRVRTDVYADRETGEKRSGLRVTAESVGLSLRYAAARSLRAERTTDQETSTLTEPMG